MKIKPEVNCPLNNFKRCKGLECSWFIQMRGTNPNTGEDVDDWACAVAWLPTLLIENASQSRQTGAAVETFRNEMVKAQEASVRVLAESQRLLQ